MNKYDEISQFYSDLEFPGRYTKEDLNYYRDKINNVYLKGIDENLSGNQILDIGSGTGLITNLFAQRYTNSTFTAVDISNSIEFGKKFAKENNINNTTWIQENFLTYNPAQKFDTIICQGVLHHIPDWPIALEKIKNLLNPGGILLLGVYHPVAKFLQKIFHGKYQSSILECDQFQNPYETAFTQYKITKLAKPMTLLNKYPSRVLTFRSSFIASGGLMLYVFKR